MSLYDSAKIMLDRLPANDIELRKSMLELMAQAVEVDSELAKAKRRIEELEKVAFDARRIWFSANRCTGFPRTTDDSTVLFAQHVGELSIS